MAFFSSFLLRSVTDPRDGKRVALKKMPNVFQNLVSCKRVFRELKMLCFFKHDNVSSHHPLLFFLNQLVLPNSRYLRTVPMVPLAGAWLALVVPGLLVPGKRMSYEGWCQCPRSLASKLTSGALSLFLHRCCQLWIFCSLHTSTTLRKCILNRKLI